MEQQGDLMTRVKRLESLRAIALFRSSLLEGYKSAVMEYGRWLMWHWER